MEREYCLFTIYDRLSLWLCKDKVCHNEKISLAMVNTICSKGMHVFYTMTAMNWDACMVSVQW